MKFDVEGEDRPGITARILAQIAENGLDITRIEVVPNHVYIDAPMLTSQDFPTLERRLKAVPGVHALRTIATLPGEQREQELQAALAAIPSPVFVIDRNGVVRHANDAAADAFNRRDLAGTPVSWLFANQDSDLILAAGMGRAQAEITIDTRSYLPEILPVGDAGRLVLLHPPSRIGSVLSATTGAPGGTPIEFSQIIGKSQAMEKLKAHAERLARIDAPILILGPTGAGKELLARAVHAASARARHPFLALNCAAFPENLAESELFGYAPGAFSGAHRGGKPGLVEMAEGGILFLDEVAELTPYLQAKLLRFLQDGTFRRIGGRNERQSEVRVLAATNRDLSQMIAEGSFREDLFYRLNVLNLLVPALKDRREDIAPLTHFLVQRAARQIGRTPPHVEAGALARLEAHDWPGNVRELENLLFRTISLLDEDRITAGDLALPAHEPAAGEARSLRAAVAAFEADLLLQLYRDYPSTRKLARRLDVSHQTIADKLKRYGIE